VTELPETRQSVQVSRKVPHPPPAVASGAEPAARPRRRVGAVGGLSLTVVNHGPTLPRLDGEGLGVAVARLWHTVHGSNGTRRLPLGAPEKVGGPMRRLVVGWSAWPDSPQARRVPIPLPIRRSAHPYVLMRGHAQGKL
jgi:hypothetical protein